ncbi:MULTISPECIES: hypothetical protein [unclassified Butyrivibrio]|uniref:hypothetical protein n=1 Tax=unclassified Butyrivibrio TaxID=2639466 RepID=UPI00042812C3|nr:MULTISPECIES: hypothetical protein [unclassified Butyrivibrio]
MEYNKIKDLCYKRGGQSTAVILAMHTTERCKLIRDELVNMKKARNLLRDELLIVYSFLAERDLLETYLDSRDGRL